MLHILLEIFPKKEMNFGKCQNAKNVKGIQRLFFNFILHHILIPCALSRDSQGSVKNPVFSLNYSLQLTHITRYIEEKEWCHMWVELVVGSRLAVRVFLLVL